MRVSVIVCTYNRADLLLKALESLAGLTPPPSTDWEILVVDNNSDDATKRVCELFSSRYPGTFRYIFERRQGKSFALNTGVAESQSELLAFTDDDITAHPQWLVELIAAFERFNCAGIGGKIVPVWNIPKPYWLEMEGPHRLMNAVVSFDLGEAPCAITTSALGANFAFRREVFEKYGGFRTDLGPTAGSEIRGEDSELCRRLLKAGERLVYSPTAVIYHPVEQKRTQKRYFQEWYFHRGRASVRESGTPVNAIRYFGVPRYLYVALGRHLLKWILCPNLKLRFYHKLHTYEIWGQVLESRASCPLPQAQAESR
jgi:glucosyl-dolichyl phosphate glucuronosyltransferase